MMRLLTKILKMSSDCFVITRTEGQLGSSGHSGELKERKWQFFGFKFSAQNQNMDRDSVVALKESLMRS